MAPTPLEGILLGIAVSVITIVLIYQFTKSKWSWVPEIILGIIAGELMSLIPPAGWPPF